MKKAELILANFDARIPNIEIKPQNTDSKVVFSSKMYDEDDEHDMLNCFNRLQRVVSGGVRLCKPQICFLMILWKKNEMMV